jgi:hypothetical protein
MPTNYDGGVVRLSVDTNKRRCMLDRVAGHSLKRIAMSDQLSVPAKRPFWRRGLAGVLDFFTVFFVGGYVVAWLTGGLTNDGFRLNGLPAFVVFLLIGLYFYLGWKKLGGTIWQRALKAR